ncbi:disulfide isomerase [Chrysochromulina tobinii]|uniref:Disulfide isomerase n=1 Tax=Chrysochromulina tobinii TaxID=1460289 RepID=A0A0M0JF83_9EUKA|nr:disulfide isomerase [Chrysochromulina tobinii]|eukprot:KOO25095.1 disulfide isomerase [Chrysochromulina sp. CCMP291]
MASLLSIVLSWTALLALAQTPPPLYDFGESPLTKLDDTNFDQTVIKDDRHLWVVEYYADWCGHCKQFAKGFQKAAENLAGIVKFGAVNADESKKTVQAAGVQGYPSVKLYLPGSGSRNPYTGKFYKTPVDYSGPRTAKGVVEFATATLPSLVVPVTDKSLAKFQKNGTLPKAVLFTKKEETPPLLKSLSVQLQGRMLLGEARETAEKTVAEFGVTDFPKVVVLPSAPDAAPDLSLAVSASNVAELVEGERDAWVLLFAGSEVAALSTPGGVGALAESLYGQVKVGRAAADLADRFGLKPSAQPQLVVYPFRKVGVKRKASKPFAANEEGVAAAKKAALESLPETGVMQLNGGNIDRFIAEAMQTASAQSFCLLFSDKSEIPPLLRAISLSFEGKVAFGMAQASEAALAKRFNVQKAPTLLVMFPGDKVDEQGQVPLTGMIFTPQMHGKFNYGNIANFVAQIKEEGPIEELNAATIGPLCVAKGGLCAIAMLDGAPENEAAKTAHLEMLTKLKKRKSGSPLSFSWLDATCQPSFAGAFGLSEVDLPTMIFISPTKLKWARHMGAFDVETLGAFGSLVAAGKKSTETLDAFPTLEEVDCAEVKRGAAAYAEEGEGDEGADDIMAEILAEEARAREEREAASAGETAEADAAGGGAGAKKERKDMSKLEKLEADVEECEDRDLLCMARREKQLKAVDKERKLQEQLAAIKKKKAKAKKKAKKAGKA